MAAAVLMFDALMARSSSEHEAAVKALRSAERDLTRVREAAKLIRHMSNLYRERLEGKRSAQP